MSKYAGKKVLITGGTSGIGLATARLLVSGGAHVMLTGRTKDTLEAARKEFGENAIVVESDSASLADIETLAQRIQSDFKPIDALFVNAGQTRFAPFEEMAEGAYDELFAVNTKGPYFTVQKLAPLMREGSGVVFTTSVVNVLGYPMVSAYAATKAALRSMTRSLARELLPRNIRVNAVSPGPIETPILGRLMPKDAVEKTYAQMSEANPMKRLGKAEEIARAVVFLAFEATYTTGAELPVDGGVSQL
jgi:NAD(P)-dependent dehydrogenase (short-subunit alcohol dehydrogenase family)